MRRALFWKSLCVRKISPFLWVELILPLGAYEFSRILMGDKATHTGSKLSRFEFSNELHHHALKALRDYFYVGGMPEVVKQFSQTHRLAQMRELQYQVLQAIEPTFPSTIEESTASG